VTMTETTSSTPLRRLEAPRRVLLRSRRLDRARVGAIAPTSRTAARALARSVPEVARPVVLELGAGTGAITRVLCERVPDGGRVIAIESDLDLAEYVREAVPDAEAECADARELEAVLDGAGVDRVDAVVSSLPLTLMRPDARSAVLRAAARRLHPDGEFVTITYQPSWSARARTLTRDLGQLFARVISTGPIWANLPPGRLVQARGPRP
jgi:phosphatidylethanolamine/phosphatidyl-N-methylethanolamine N-methyltransferase